MKNDYRGLIRSGKLLEVMRELQAQGMHRPPLRSCYYLLLDRGLIVDQPGGKTYDKLDAAVSKIRDEEPEVFPYGLLAPDGGTNERGLLPDELEKTIEDMRDNNVVPELCDGVLKVVLCEKAGLVDYLVAAVGGRVPVGSPGGMVRKEWAYHWLGTLRALAEKMGATRIEIVYLGDKDEGGGKIMAHNSKWFPRWQGVSFEVFAVTPDQLREFHRRELHIDGYIALVGPQEFARRLRRHLGLREAVP